MFLHEYAFLCQRKIGMKNILILHGCYILYFVLFLEYEEDQDSHVYKSCLVSFLDVITGQTRPSETETNVQHEMLLLYYLQFSL